MKNFLPSYKLRIKEYLIILECMCGLQKKNKKYEI